MINPNEQSNDTTFRRIEDDEGEVKLEFETIAGVAMPKMTMNPATAERLSSMTKKTETKDIHGQFERESRPASEPGDKV